MRKAVQLHYAHLYKGLWQRQHGRQQIRRFKAGETATGNEESCIDIGVVSLCVMSLDNLQGVDNSA
jgi:hypothetical protein